MRIKEICDFVSRGATPEYVDDSPFKVMNQATFSKGWLDESNIRFTSKPAYDAQITKGDLLMASTGGGVLGKVFYFDKEDTCFYADSHVSILRNSKGNHLMKFLYYYFLIRYEEINSTMVKGSTNQTELQRNYLLAYEINMPSLPVQQKIVDYLDEKTSAIDTQVELLEKKKDAYTRLKKAIINRAVTRGLDEHVKLKDSGVEWIGMIPEHWKVKRFKDVFRKYSTGFTPESKNIDNFSDNEEFTWVTIADMTTRVVGISNLNLSEKAIRDNMPVLTIKGSLMFSFKLTIGKTAFAEKDLYTNEAIVSIPPQRNVDLSFFYYTIPMICVNNATENIYGAKMLNQKIIANMLFAMPPYEEQQAISSCLDKECSKIDATIANIDKQTDALKRLKRSLINEVITGQRAV